MTINSGTKSLLKAGYTQINETVFLKLGGEYGSLVELDETVPEGAVKVMLSECEILAMADLVKEARELRWLARENSGI